MNLFVACSLKDGAVREENIEDVVKLAADFTTLRTSCGELLSLQRRTSTQLHSTTDYYLVAPSIPPVRANLRLDCLVERK